MESPFDTDADIGTYVRTCLPLKKGKTAEDVADWLKYKGLEFTRSEDKFNVIFEVYSHLEENDRVQVTGPGIWTKGKIGKILSYDKKMDLYDVLFDSGWHGYYKRKDINKLE